MNKTIKFAIGVVLLVTGLVLAPAPAEAQDQAGIAGTIEDTAGLVLPGVTVTAESESLLAPRAGVSDGAGNYAIQQLPPGTYAVVFTLEGFGTVRREGIVLQGSFVADIDASLAVGGVAETVVVTGEAPLVDVRSTRQQNVLTADRVNVLPGAASIFQAAQYVPGVVIAGPYGSRPELHGSDAADGLPSLDGIQTGGQLQGRSEWSGGVGTVTNEAIVTEVVFDISSQNAEYAQSGMRTNVVPKSGGNNFSYNMFATGTRARFQSDNQSQELKDQGFAFAPTAFSYSLNPAIGGPIVENKLWFYASMLQGKSMNA